MDCMEEQLKEMLENLPRSYDDFVNSMLREAIEGDAVEDMINFINETPGCRTGDVILYYIECIWDGVQEDYEVVAD